MALLIAFFGAITAALEKSDSNLQNGDILVVSTKYVSYSQGRCIPLDDVACSHDGMILGIKNTELVEENPYLMKRLHDGVCVPGKIHILINIHGAV